MKGGFSPFCPPLYAPLRLPEKLGNISANTPNSSSSKIENPPPNNDKIAQITRAQRGHGYEHSNALLRRPYMLYFKLSFILNFILNPEDITGTLMYEELLENKLEKLKLKNQP